MAKSFSFSLQKVLDVRQHKEEQKAIELHKAKQALSEERNKLKRLKTAKESLLKNEENNKKRKIGINLQELKITTDYIVQLNDRIFDQNHKVKQSNEQVNKVHELLMEAVKEKKIVEKLKERRKEAFKKEMMREQSKTENEVAIRIAMQNKVKDKG